MKVSSKATPKSKAKRRSRPKSPEPIKVAEPAQRAEAQAADLESPAALSSVSASILLGVATLACLLPFIGKALHIDDTLFIWAAQNIAKHPFDPYGFQLNWDEYQQMMFQVTKNPPFASYYAAIFGAISGWSETALHFGFLLPALTVILSTYYLAKRFTDFPLLASFATLLAPGFLISATSLMCDTLMLAIWLVAIILWIEGLENSKPRFLAFSALLIGACALTKYYGAALLPLLFAYSLYRRRHFGSWAYYFLVPVGILAGYQFWTASLYGQGLLLDAAGFATSQRANTSTIGGALEGICFVGGCMLPALTFAPLLWSRRQILVGSGLSALATLAIATGAISLGAMIGGPDSFLNVFHEHWFLFSIQLTLYIASGISVLWLAIVDFWERRTAQSLLLLLWVVGTFAFAAFFNWVVNARSVLPLLPAAAILLARRLQSRAPVTQKILSAKVLAPLLASGIFALWITLADVQLANSARTAASIIHERTKGSSISVWFAGHWGFQYYMEKFGARPVDAHNFEYREGDLFVTPENNSGLLRIPREDVSGEESFRLPGPSGATTMNSKMGAGFYAAYWGPLPFALGREPEEHYTIFRLQ